MLNTGHVEESTTRSSHIRETVLKKKDLFSDMRVKPDGAIPSLLEVRKEGY